MNKKKNDFEEDLLFGPLIKRTLRLLAGKHWFKLSLRNIDRNTNKEKWKAISRWLRVARNKIEQELTNRA